MKEISVNDIPASVSATDIKFASWWIKVTARGAHMTPRWFGFVGAGNDIGSEPYNAPRKVYVWNSRRALVLDDSDCDYVSEYV